MPKLKGGWKRRGEEGKRKGRKSKREDKKGKLGKITKKINEIKKERKVWTIDLKLTKSNGYEMIMITFTRYQKRFILAS